MSDATISVPGVGRTSAAPDVVTVNVGVTITRPSVAEASAAATERATAILAALRSNGVADADVRTADYTVGPRFEYPPDSGPRRAGYDVTMTFEAHLRDVAGAGAVIDAAVAAGGDDCVVNGIRFERDDRGAGVIEARRLAFEDASARAAQLAALAGARLGGVVRIDETEQGGGMGPHGVFMAAKSATPVPAGQVAEEVRLLVVFGIDQTAG